VSVLSDSIGGQLTADHFASPALPNMALFSAGPVPFSYVYTGPPAVLSVFARWGSLRSPVVQTLHQDIGGLKITQHSFSTNLSTTTLFNITLMVTDSTGRQLATDSASTIVALPGYGLELLGDPLAKTVDAGLVTFSWYTNRTVTFQSTVRFRLSNLEVASPLFAVPNTPAPTPYRYVALKLILAIGRFTNVTQFNASLFLAAIAFAAASSANGTASTKICPAFMAAPCFANASLALQYYGYTNTSDVSNGTAWSSTTAGLTAPSAQRSSRRRLQQNASAAGIDVYFEFQPAAAQELTKQALAATAIVSLRRALALATHPIRAQLLPLSDLRIDGGATFAPLPPEATSTTPPPTEANTTRYPLVIIDASSPLSVRASVLAAVILAVASTFM
jgi:hypothetical protein